MKRDSRDKLRFLRGIILNVHRTHIMKMFFCLRGKIWQNEKRKVETTKTKTNNQPKNKYFLHSNDDDGLCCDAATQRSRCIKNIWTMAKNYKMKWEEVSPTHFFTFAYVNAIEFDFSSFTIIISISSSHKNLYLFTWTKTTQHLDNFRD